MSSIFLLLLIMGLGVYSNGEPNFDDKPLIIKNIINVYDGDTFRANLGNCGRDLFCNNIRIRLEKIDAPSLRATSLQEREIAIEARNYLNEILSTAYLLELKKCERGKYFRLVCDVRADGLNISDLMIDSGLAKPYE